MLFLLIILGVIVLIGLIRVIITPSDNFVDLFLNFFLIDFFCDVLSAIFKAICDIVSDTDW
jgi:hypothetical protein